MLGKLTALIAIITSCSLYALPNSEILANLKSRLHPLADNQGYLIKSFADRSQSYIYDQALAIITFANEGDKDNSERLLKGLSSLQMKDGSLYFSYYIDGKSPYPIEGDKRYAGAIAWVALAASHFQHRFKTTKYVQFNTSILKYLKSQMGPIKIHGNRHMALRFSPSDIKSTAWNEHETTALEHNLDAYSAFLHFSSLNKTKVWNIEISNLKLFILSMWDGPRSHFWSGANLKTGLINKEELYLDNQSWSMLALDKKTLKEINSHKALALNCEVFYVEKDGIIGFMDSKPTTRPSKFKFIWSEGSAGQILAMKRIDKIEKKESYCANNSSSELLNSIKKMKNKDGGIAYSTKTEDPDFTTSSSVAGTTWYYFASNNFNPFHLDDLEPN